MEDVNKSTHHYTASNVYRIHNPSSYMFVTALCGESPADAFRIEKGLKSVHTTSVSEYDVPIASLAQYDAPPFELSLQFHTLDSRTH